MGINSIRAICSPHLPSAWPSAQCAAVEGRKVTDTSLLSCFLWEGTLPLLQNATTQCGRFLPLSQGKSSIFISLARKLKVTSNSLYRHLAPWGVFFHLIWDSKPVPAVHCAPLKSAVKPRVSIHSMAQSTAKAGLDEWQTANNWEIPQQPLNQELQRLEFCLLRCLRCSMPLSAYTHSQVERQKTFNWRYFAKGIVCSSKFILFLEWLGEAAEWQSSLSYMPADTTQFCILSDLVSHITSTNSNYNKYLLLVIFQLYYLLFIIIFIMPDVVS